ncbi:Elongator subunit elp4 [Tilletia horrida]|uniref:Elongator complex protein 4 n=1 Tax=Tilletia horrida TaxID=155126 RepID=A0AAN6GWY5_9BASI|nr:Elongator subunit elp4 [Tilletia horrida]
MSSFKRRVPAVASSVGSHASTSAAAQLPAGVRPSATSSLPQPLLSTGIASLDDLVAGRGIPSGTSLLLIPEAYAASSSSSTNSSSRDPWTVNTAEPYTDLLLAYSLAQGIAHQHHNLVITQHPQPLLQSLMARIGDSSQDAPPAQADAAQTEQPQQPQDSLKIAFRYANLPILNSESRSSNASSSQDSEDAKKEFPSTFDLSRRISPRTLEKAKADGIVECIDIPGSHADPYEHAWTAIQATAQRLKAAAKQNPTQAPPVLRIHIRALGSPAWQEHSTSTATLTRFLLRIKILLRSLSVPTFPASSSQQPLIPAIATISLSSHILTGPPSLLSSAYRENDDDIDIAHRLASLADTTLALSSFEARPSLRHLLVPSGDKKSKSGKSSSSSLSKHGYTGAIRVLHSASGIGGWNSEVVRASVLRGMSSSASSNTSSGGGGAGGGSSGAGENDLAFRVGRKKLAIELLNVDDVGLARKEEEEQQASAAAGSSAGKQSLDGGFAQKMEELRIKEEELRAIAMGLGGAGGSAADGGAKNAAASPASPSSPSSSFQKKAPTASPSSTPKPGTKPQPQPTGAMPKFGGLASLRQKGLAARAAASSSAASGGAPRSVSVELEGSASPTTGASKAEGPAPTPKAQHRRPVFETRPDQLEF